MTLTVRTAADIDPKPPPVCPTCGNPMPHYGGTMGYICCGWKLLYRSGGWFKGGRGYNGQRVSDPLESHVDRDTRLAKGLRR